MEKEKMMKIIKENIRNEINLEDIAPFDKDGLFPKKGMLSFFYCVTDEDLFYGTDPKDKGYAKVFYFEDVDNLTAAKFPRKLDADFRISEKAVSFSEDISYPTAEVLFDRYKGFDWDEYNECMEENDYYNEEVW